MNQVNNVQEIAKQIKEAKDNQEFKNLTEGHLLSTTCCWGPVPQGAKLKEEITFPVLPLKMMMFASALGCYLSSLFADD